MKSSLVLFLFLYYFISPNSSLSDPESKQVDGETDNQDGADFIVGNVKNIRSISKLGFGSNIEHFEPDKIILVDAQKPMSEKLASSPDAEESSTKKPILAKPKSSNTAKGSKKPKQATKSESVTSEQEITTTQIPSNSSPEASTSTLTSISTTPPPTTTTISTKPIPEDLYCLCDIHSHACDMNCCCDTDCKDEDRKFFSYCLDQAGVHDERSVSRRQRSCYKHFVTFKHYMAENEVLNDKGMLCIIRDNSKVDNVLPILKLDEINKRIIDGVINIQPKYSMDSNRKVQYNSEPYKFGRPILGLKVKDLLKLSKTNDKVELIPYGLPASYHSMPCTEIKEPVKFLQNFHSLCKHSIRRNLAQDCNTMQIYDANYFINEMKILTNPGKKSDSDDNSSDERESISITAQKVCNGELCSSELEDIDPNEFPHPVYNVGKKLCQNMLKELNITFHFNLDGITGIFASAQLQDLPISKKELTQEFRSNFQWNETATTTELNNLPPSSSSWPRSGNPGYIVGKPVIMGEKVTILKENLGGKVNGIKDISTVKTPTEEDEDDEKRNKEVEMVKVSTNPAEWMSIHGPGICHNDEYLLTSRRKSVLFGYSHMTMCSLNLTRFKYCEDLQLQVAKILLGMNDPLNFEKLKLHVAAFGNSNPDEPSGWVPVTTKNMQFGLSSLAVSNKGLISKGCDSIMSTLHITITYAFVGSVDFPQAKITGVLYEPGESISFLPKDLSKSFDVSTTVSFKDVTTPAIMRVAKWPILSITLPKDFFYPFSR